MTLHKHWSVPAHADEPTPAEVAPAAPVATKAWVAVWRTENEPDGEIRLFSTMAKCEEWRQSIARDNWNTGQEEPEDAEEAADRYFEYNEEDGESFSYSQHNIR